MKIEINKDRAQNHTLRHAKFHINYTESTKPLNAKRARGYNLKMVTELGDLKLSTDQYRPWIFSTFSVYCFLLLLLKYSVN